MQPFRIRRSVSYFICILVCCSFALSSRPAAAAVVYDLVDHGVPDHSLSGTITVTDDAVSDGVLMGSEVVSWQLTVMGTDVNFSFGSDSPSYSLAILGIVNISTDSIVIPMDELDPPNTGWSQTGFLYSSIGNEFFDWNWLVGEDFDGSEVFYYQSGKGEAGLGQANVARSHATASVVPEPSTFLGVGLIGLGFLVRTNSRRIAR